MMFSCDVVATEVIKMLCSGWDSVGVTLRCDAEVEMLWVRRYCVMLVLRCCTGDATKSYHCCDSAGVTHRCYVASVFLEL